MTNPSTIWATLALPSSPAGSIPFVAIDNQTIVIDALNFNYTAIGTIFNIGVAGDFTGTDTISIYKQVDTYLPVTQQAAVSGTPGVPPSVTTLSALSVINGLSISSSRGTGQAPQALLSGDLIGVVQAWAYVAAGYLPTAGEFFYARGSVAGNVGGEIHWTTKVDGGVLTDRITLDSVGALFPTAANTAAFTSSARLGKAGFGFSAFTLLADNSVVVGNQTHMTPAGSLLVAAAQSVVTLTNPLISANSIVLAQLNTNDSTATGVRSVLCSTGQAVITLNAATTAQVRISYFIVGSDT